MASTSGGRASSDAVARASEDAEALAVVLDTLRWGVAASHLRQASAGLLEGRWESSNSQTRAFLEAVCNDIAAFTLRGSFLRDTVHRTWNIVGGEARKALETKGFLSPADALLLKSFFGVLHGEGSHAGRSDEADATCRLATAVALGRFYISEVERRRKSERSRLNWMEELAKPIIGPFGSGSTVGGYRSVDFQTCRVDYIDDVDVLVEFVYSYRTISGSLDADWLNEFDDAMEDIFEEFDALVLTAIPLSATARSASQPIAVGVYNWRKTIVVVEIVREDHEMSVRAIDAAKDWIADARISRARESQSGEFE